MAPVTPTAPAHRAKRLRDKLRALAATCPFGDDNPPDCPLHELRKRDSREVLRWLSGLSESETGYLESYHDCCLAVKLEKKLGASPGSGR